VKLQWWHTELGRRTPDETYRVVRQNGGWQLLDREWLPLAPPCATIVEAQQIAERLAARAAALPRGTSPTESRSGGDV
jgi:hypothetical protein